MRDYKAELLKARQLAADEGKMMLTAKEIEIVDEMVKIITTYNPPVKG